MSQTLKKSYDLFLVDILGIIHDGQKIIPSNINFINELVQDPYKRVIFLSNAPRLEQQTRASLLGNGVQEPFDVITSGEATRYFLQEYVPTHSVYHFGERTNKDILHGHPQHNVTSPFEADLILLTAFLEEDEDDSLYQKEFEEVVNANKKIICANPDTYAHFNGKRRRVAGYIAKQLLARGCDVHFIGKPDPFIYELTFKRFEIADQLKSKTVMIGDTLENDIAGANAFGIDSALVLTGNTAWQISNQPGVVFDYVRSTADKKHLIPTHIFKNL